MHALHFTGLFFQCMLGYFSFPCVCFLLFYFRVCVFFLFLFQSLFFSCIFFLSHHVPANFTPSTLKMANYCELKIAWGQLNWWPPPLKNFIFIFKEHCNTLPKVHSTKINLQNNFCKICDKNENHMYFSCGLCTELNTPASLSMMSKTLWWHQTKMQKKAVWKSVCGKKKKHQWH